jgi:hypothetical protein
VPAPSAKRDSKQSLLDRADAMLGKLEDDLKTAASVAVSGVELASKLASLSRSAPGDARPAGEPKPPARPAPKKP